MPSWVPTSWTGQMLGWLNLEGDAPAELRVLRQVNGAHAALAELLQDTITPELFGQRPGGHGRILIECVGNR